jgi:hypothetical protein
MLRLSSRLPLDTCLVVCVCVCVCERSECERCNVTVSHAQLKASYTSACGLKVLVYEALSY